MSVERGEQLGTPGTTVTDYAYAPWAACPMHYHEHAYLSLLLSGSHVERSGRGGRLLSIELPPSWISRLDGYQIATHRASWLNRPDASALMLRIHAEIGSSDPILDRAGRPFPLEPIRTLDAIHLATAEFLGDPPQLVTVLTRDASVRDNARALGFITA